MISFSSEYQDNYNPSRYNYFEYESISNTNENMNNTSDKFFGLLSLLLVPRALGTKIAFDVCNNFAENGKVPYGVTAIAACIFCFCLIVLVVISVKLINSLCNKYIESDGTGFALFNRTFICIPVITALVAGTIVLYKSLQLRQRIEDWDGVSDNKDLILDFKMYYCTEAQQWFLFIVICLLLVFLIYCLSFVLRSRFLHDMSARGINWGKYAKAALYVLAALAIIALVCLAALALKGSLGNLFKNSILSKLLGALAILMCLGLLGAIFGKFILAALKSLFSALKNFFGRRSFRSGGSGQSV
jgi:hypothetical protein